MVSSVVGWSPKVESESTIVRELKFSTIIKFFPPIYHFVGNELDSLTYDMTTRENSGFQQVHFHEQGEKSELRDEKQ